MAELTQRTDYDLLALQAKGMLEEEPWYTAAMSNLSALLMDTMEKLNWAGFYLMRDGRLVVGPFQGKPACIHIAVGKGVCGTAVAEDKLQLVPDVHQFPGHIACDSASESEIVVPIHHNGEIVAVLDIDSPIKERFDETDAEGLQKFVQIIEENISWE
jgi:GAF domain-containing protein